MSLFPLKRFQGWTFSSMILLPETVDLSIDQVIANDAMIVTSRSREFTAACPSCGQAAKRVHSRYRRKLSDLAVSGRPVRLVLETRGFFCDNAWCPRKTFAEQTPNLVRPHAQRMVRLRSPCSNWA